MKVIKIESGTYQKDVKYFFQNGNIKFIKQLFIPLNNTTSLLQQLKDVNITLLNGESEFVDKVPLLMFIQQTEAKRKYINKNTFVNSEVDILKSYLTFDSNITLQSGFNIYTT